MTADGSDRSFGAPRFDVVLRGYDRRQVDEHVSHLQWQMGRMRGDLEAARSRPMPPTGSPTPAGGRPRPTPRPRFDEGPPAGANDVVGTFTDRMHAILQAAEEEAAEIRKKARAAARADEERAAAVRAATRMEEETARKTLADLVRQRDSVLAELTRVRGQLEGLLSGPTTRITLPIQDRVERREAGAGQPLPGTPGPAEPVPAGETVAVAASPPSAPFPAAGGPAPARTATGTAVFVVPGAGESSSDEAVEPAVSPAEATAFIEPLIDEPEASRVESTQMVEPPVRPADDTAREAADEPTQVAPASPARSG